MAAMVASQASTTAIQKAPEILETKTVQDTVYDVRQSVLDKEKRGEWGETAKDAFKGVGNGLYGVREFGAEMLGKNYESPNTRSDKAIMEALIEYRQIYQRTDDAGYAERKYWDKINEANKDPGVKIDTAKALETLQASQNTGKSMVTGATGGCDECGGKKKQGWVRTIFGGNDSGAVITNSTATACVDIAVMILAIIFMVVLIYWFMKGGEMTADAKIRAKNVMLGSGTIIIALSAWRIFM